MSEWISVAERLPKTTENVDLWIVGEAVMVEFYDPFTKKQLPVNGVKCGRATDWFYCDGLWHAVGGLVPVLSHSVRATHWMSRPNPPIGQ
jgi:hypothetical protein